MGKYSFVKYGITTSVFVIGLFLQFGLTAQPLVIDSTFQPFFKVQDDLTKRPGSVSRIIEDAKNGKIYFVGNFSWFNNGVNYNGILTSTRSGTPINSFVSSGMAQGVGKIQRVNDSILLMVRSGNYSAIDTNGRIGGGSWANWRKSHEMTVDCASGQYPFFFENGASLMANLKGNNDGCSIVNPPDTFPHRYIIKLDSLGYWDSTFTPDANNVPLGFLRYDSSRIWIFGNPRDFRSYGGIQVDGLCRIFHDGTLDITFSSPLEPLLSATPIPALCDKEGRFFLKGYFKLKNDTTAYKLARFLADGSLDTSFLNGDPDDTSEYLPIMHTIIQTKDGGYLIGGRFNKYQGQPVNSLAKLDEFGNLQPEYFTSRGPDSSSARFGFSDSFPHAIGEILESKFGGYYVVGDFTHWDGKPSQPVVRLVDQSVVGLKKRTQNKKLIKVYPNPTTELLTLESPLKLNRNDIRLYDLLGRLQKFSMEQTGSYRTRINMAGLPSGVYILRIHRGKNEFVEKKVIKRR